MKLSYANRKKIFRNNHHKAKKKTETIKQNLKTEKQQEMNSYTRILQVLRHKHQLLLIMRQQKVTDHFQQS